MNNVHYTLLIFLKYNMIFKYIYFTERFVDHNIEWLSCSQEDNKSRYTFFLYFTNFLAF